MITAELLVAAVGCSKADAAKWAPHLLQACAAHYITTPARVAAFLAQIGHESGSLRYVREIADGSAYEGRADLGNTEKGDGQRYRGRGLIQITGRKNYRETTRRLQWANPPDFEDFPAALEEPFWAAYSAADWWQAHTLSSLADTGEFIAIGREINRGSRYSDKPANGEADRLIRWERAKAAVAAQAGQGAPIAPAPIPTQPQAPAAPSIPAGEASAPEQTMPLPAIVGALLPSLIESIPKLGKLFGSGSAVAERNVKAAELAVQIVKDATGAVNIQDAVEKVKADPAVAAVAAQAIEARWLELDEAGSGGIAAARKTDAETAARGDMLHSPSFWVALMLLPLVYLFVLSLIGLLGDAQWSTDVRAGLAGSIISAIIGGLVGFYFGQTTTRNRTPAP